MRRRGNKSHKVPNVKLRPAQPTDSVSRLAQFEKHWVEESQAGSDDASVLDLCPRPFKNIVVCATGVVDKPTLFKQALELGATSVTAFTDRVTHLVAKDHGGAKYMCALERKIPILTPSWVNESYQIWLKGDDVDVAESVEKHRLPIFSNVILCPSGIGDITRRTQINKLLTRHGGAYLKNLERPVKVTHLLCSGDEETEKMIYAEKFNQRGEAKIHLVWEEWFWDSLDFGGRFDESRYQVRRPRPERKTLAEAATPPPTSSAQPSELDEELAPLPKERSPPQPQSFDDFEDEAASVKIIPTVTLQMWGGLLQRRGYEIAGGEVIRSPSKSTSKPRQQEEEQPPSPVQRGGSVISSFRRANSFAPGAPVSHHPQPFRRTSAAPEKVGESSTSGAAASPVVLFFSGLRFCVLGEAKSPLVRTAIEKHGGRWVSEEDEDVDFFVVRLLSGSKIYQEQADESQRSKYRTECWLERCLHEERVCPIEDHVANVPLAIRFPIPGAESVRMSLSGLDEADAHGIKRLMRALGVVIPSVFSKKATHLLCPSGTGLKFEKAQEWGIPVVSVGWLSAMATSGVVPDVEPYLVGGLGDVSPPPPLPAEESMQTYANLPSNKGKGKARAADTEDGMEIDNQMHDITNNSPPNDPSAPPRGPLDRQDTTIIPQESWSAFGLPDGTLGASAYQICPSSIRTPSGSNASPVVRYGTRQNSSVLPSAPGSFSHSSNQESNPVPALSNREVEAERKQARIPSSKSPSPMKALKTGRFMSHSPDKIDCGATKALQESITSLLGKRQPSDDRDEGTALAGAAGPAGKNGKRSRPNRSKVQSRQASDARIAAVPNPRVGFSGRNSRRSPFDGLDQVEFKIDEQVEESMRVMYEDPDQRDEKKRLMNLLKNQAEDELPVPSGRTRRSTRMAGF